MPEIPFVLSQFSNPAMSYDAVQQRFVSFWLKFQKQRAEAAQGETGDSRALSSTAHGYRADCLPKSVHDRINRRARIVSDRHSKMTSTRQLKAEDRKLLEPLRDGVSVSNIDTEHEADEIAAALHAEYPWLGRATEHVWHSMRHSVQTGNPALRIRPLLLDGPPGIGKTAWAQSLAKLMKVQNFRLDATTDPASFGLVGSQKGWGNSSPGKLMNFMLSQRVGNPVVILDEIEKAGSPSSTQGHTFGLHNALLPLLEPLSAARWACPYFQLEFDMRWVNWILTSNNSRQVPQPLLSRCPPIQLQPMAHSDLAGVVRKEAKRRGLNDASAEAICMALAWAFENDRSANLRTVIRMLDRAELLENRPAAN